jgi:hypothetical protein
MDDRWNHSLAKFAERMEAVPAIAYEIADLTNRKL